LFDRSPLAAAIAAFLSTLLLVVGVVLAVVSGIWWLTIYGCVAGGVALYLLLSWP